MGPITIDSLKSVSTVYYHASCPDGTASAMLIAAAFRLIGHKAEFKPLQYGTAEMDDLVPYKGQMFVDITPPRDKWEDWKEFEPIVLDHHESSKAVTEGLGGIYGTNDKYSGAMLAHEFVFLPCVDFWMSAMAAFTKVAAGGCEHSVEHLRPQFNKWRDFATLAMVRDTWKSKHELWGRAHALQLATSFEGSKNLIEKAQLGEFDFDTTMSLGEKLKEKHDKKVELIAQGAHWVDFAHGDSILKLASFNTTEKIISDVGNYLLENGADVAVGYFYMREDEAFQAVVSLRTNEKISASRVCESLGGGGHARAAGFRIKTALISSPGSIEDVVIRTIG